MYLFRNKDLKMQLISQFILTVLALILIYAFQNLALVFLLIYGLCIMLLTIYNNKKRYDNMSALADSIDQILHGQSDIVIAEHDEGELAILQSEIYKMTIALKKQSEDLINDKVYLADSIADISHQLRTPLTSMRLINSLLMREDLTMERRVELSYELNALLSRMNFLIEALLKISKLDTGTVHFENNQFLLKDLVKEAIAPLEIALELNEQTVEITGGDSASMNGDITWCSEAVTNIIKNCMEHSQPQGHLKLYYMENAIYSEIKIIDSGSGIDKEDLPHIFERFYRGKNASSQSFGIGLALSRMIITSQNGTIKAENNRDKGTTFTIKFYKQI